MKISPQISVIMPVYNCEKYIETSVRSVLNQTFNDFELIIIDDASDDKTTEIINNIKDTRIKFIEKPINTGYTRSLNLGIKMATGDFIARMDADDICRSDRFEKQISYLTSHPEVIVCGTGYTILGKKESTQINPESHEQIKLQFLKGNCVVHPSVMIRGKVIRENNLFYNIKLEPAEDYDFWIRLLQYGELYNLPEFLIQYRIHADSVSRRYAQQQEMNSALAKITLLEYLELKFNSEEKKLLSKIFTTWSSLTFHELKKSKILLSKLQEANNGFFQHDGFQDYLLYLSKRIFFKYIHRYDRYNPLIYLNYQKIKNDWKVELKFHEELRLFLKSFFYWKI